MSAGSRSRLARRAHDLAVDWTLHVTRGLPDAVAKDRFEQIVSDLWEHAAARADSSGARLALAIVRRTLLGVPADLVWRSSPAARDVRPAPLPRPRLAAVDGHRFDQTNGRVDFDAVRAPVPDTGVGHLLGTAIAANAVAVGFTGSN